jgi:hypothetical protein
LIKAIHVFDMNANAVGDLIQTRRSKHRFVSPIGRLTKTRRCEENRALTHGKLSTARTAFTSITEPFYKPKCLTQPLDSSSDIIINERRHNWPWRC